MELNESYRWNVPVVTYGFDEEFINYFGEGGIQEVEKAVAILNGLPPASQIDLANSPLEAWRENEVAAALGILDLKSAALDALLEQFGLTDPIRFTWTLHERLVDQSGTNFVVIQRNFDPETREASSTVNGEEYSYALFPAVGSGTNVFADAVEESAIIPSPMPLSFPVAGARIQAGLFCETLSRDDVAGLRFLLSSENRKVERLLEGVTSGPGNTNAVVDTASRPGVEKIQLIRLASKPGGFEALTNVFTDTYFDHGLLQTQQLQRVITTPDILFSARDFGVKFLISTNFPLSLYSDDLWSRTDAGHWQNNAQLNGNSSGSGPGIIRPGAQITFSEMGRYSGLGGVYNLLDYWGAFDELSDMVAYSGQTLASTATVSTTLSRDAGQPVLVWKFVCRGSANYIIQASDDLTHWVTVDNVISPDIGVLTYSYPAVGEARYVRAIFDGWGTDTNAGSVASGD